MKRPYANAVREAMGNADVLLAAAGVAVLRHGQDILLLQRPDGEWDLPGGHLELGESLEQAAIRETFEETGLKVEELELLGVASGKDVYMATRKAFYVTAIYMTFTFSGALRPGKEHKAGQFFDLANLPNALSKTVQRVAPVVKKKLILL